MDVLSHVNLVKSYRYVAICLIILPVANFYRRIVHSHVMPDGEAPLLWIIILLSLHIEKPTWRYPNLQFLKKRHANGFIIFYKRRFWRGNERKYISYYLEPVWQVAESEMRLCNFEIWTGWDVSGMRPDCGCLTTSQNPRSQIWSNRMRFGCSYVISDPAFCCIWNPRSHPILLCQHTRD
jgi:hypothetical protein